MAAVKGLCLIAVTVLIVSTLAPVRLTSARVVDREMLRKFFQCPVCDPYTCPYPAVPGCELVLEPGVCGCCLVCAQQKGESCGLTSGRCGKGLACRPRPDDPDPVGAILNGKAVCM